MVAARLPDALCLGHTSKGQPCHPLYLPSTASLVPSNSQDLWIGVLRDLLIAA